MIKKPLYLTLFCFLLSIPAANAGDTATLTNPAAGIVVVDVQKIVQQAKATQDIENQMNKKIEVLKNKATNREKEFKKRFGDLENQKNVLSKEAFEEKSMKLGKDVDEFNRVVYTERATLDKAQAEAFAAVEVKMGEILQKRAVGSPIKIVLYKEHTLYSAPELDITSEILKELDVALPAVVVDFTQKPATK